MRVADYTYNKNQFNIQNRDSLNFSGINAKGAFKLLDAIGANAINAGDVVDLKKAAKPAGLSDNIKKAMEFGDELSKYIKNDKVSLGDIDGLLKEYISIVELPPSIYFEMLEKAGANGGAAAKMSPLYDKKGALESLVLSTKKPKDWKDCREVGQYVANLTHELTHGYQFINNKGQMPASKLKPMQEVFTLGICDAIEHTFITSSNKKLFTKRFTSNDMIEECKSIGLLYPTPVASSKEAVLGYLNYKSMDEFKDMTQHNFDRLFANSVNMEIENNPKNVSKNMPHSKKPEKFKELVRDILVTRFEMEAEAYKADSEMIKKYFGVKGECNTDFNSTVYELLKEALCVETKRAHPQAHSSGIYLNKLAHSTELLLD